MSRLVTTEFGRLNHVQGGWIWECPQCGAWGGLSEDQLAGRVSVVCSGPNGNQSCQYHETHPFGAALVARMQARILCGDDPCDAGDI